MHFVKHGTMERSAVYAPRAGWADSGEIPIKGISLWRENIERRVAAPVQPPLLSPPASIYFCPVCFFLLIIVHLIHASKLVT